MYQNSKFLTYAQQPFNLASINNPSSTARIKGCCGDSMEIFLKMNNDKITNANFKTDGCGTTLACGSTFTGIIKNRPEKECLIISPRHIIEHLNVLPKEAIRCAILAVMTFQKSSTAYIIRN